MKICVYAITKNESVFAERWYNSMKEADSIVVLDTGSTDGTQDILRNLGVTVIEEEIKPWRFDVARNRSLFYVPDDVDICVCTDIDEYFNPGWREKIEQVWKEGITRIQYKYVWSFNPDGSEGTVFLSDKIHTKNGYSWVGAVHEVLKPSIQENTVVADTQVNHTPIPKPTRANYLPLLELAVKEDPNNDRNTHYLGREYMYVGRWEDSINMLKKHLALPTAKWYPERAASMRFIAYSYMQLGGYDSSELWYLRAIAEAPDYREAYVELADLLYKQKRWSSIIYYIEQAIRIRNRPLSYICEAKAWGSLPYDMLCIAYWELGNVESSYLYAELALDMEPTNQRLLNNYNIIKNIVENKKSSS